MITISRQPKNARETALVQEARDVLDRPYPEGLTELQRAQAYYANPPPPPERITCYDFRRYRENEVCVAIDALFYRKCAFCESTYSATKSRNVEHYRPKGGVAEHQPQHPGYWWLAATWENLLASCGPCNKRGTHSFYTTDVTLAEYQAAMDREGTATSGKANCFPLSGDNWVTVAGGNLAGEDPLLINPCERDPAIHLEWGFDWDQTYPIWLAPLVVAFLKPKQLNGVDDPYGAKTIEILGLNRAGLMRDREKKVLALQAGCKRAVTRITAAAPGDRAARMTEAQEELSDQASAEQLYTSLAKAFINVFPREFARHFGGP